MAGKCGRIANSIVTGKSSNLASKIADNEVNSAVKKLFDRTKEE
jgi:hypothetical protein